MIDAVTAPHQLHFEFGGFFVFCFVGYRGPSREQMMRKMHRLSLRLCDHCPLLMWRLMGEVLALVWRLLMLLSKLLSGKLVLER